MKKKEPKIVITTQESDQAGRLGKLLEDNRLKVVNFPLIHIEPIELNQQMKVYFDDLSVFTWLVFTSRNGVKAFLELYKSYKNQFPDLSSNKIAAIGNPTALVLQENGYSVDFINPGSTSVDFMHEVDKQEVISNVESVLLVLGNLAPDSLMLKIKEITSRVKRIDVYRTSYVKSVYSEFKELIENDDYSIIVFTSPSGFDNFLQHFGKYINNKENLRIASIGKTTSRFISLRGFPITLESPKSTFEDLAESIYKYLKK